MSANSLKSFCELVENTPRHFGNALRVGLENLVTTGGKKIKKLHRHYQTRGFWSTFGMLSAHFFMLCVLGLLYTALMSMILVLLALFWEVSWTTILTANILALSISAAVSWGEREQLRPDTGPQRQR